MRSLFSSRIFTALLVHFVIISLATPFLTLAAAPIPQPPFDSQAFPPSAIQILPPLQASPTASHPKMDSVLVELSQAALDSPEAATALSKKRNLTTQGSKVHVQVTVAEGQSQAAIAAIQGLGGEISGSSMDGQLFQGWLPAQALARLAEQKSIAYIRQPAQAIVADDPLAVDVTSEAIAVINAPAWHAAGLSGGGVKLAIIDAGFTGYPNLLGSELPISVTVKNFVDGQEGLDVTGTTNHGTAVAEVIFDIAPQTSLYLIKISTPIDLQEAVNWLITQDVDIISTSVGWHNVSPGDGTGFFADLAQLAHDHDILWVTAAGNSRTMHWGGTFNDLNNDSYHDYELIGPDYYLVNFFSPGPDEAWVIPAGTTISGYLRWDDWTEVNQDYNLILVRYVNIPPAPPYWTTVADSKQVQSGLPGQTPTEFVSAVAPYTTFYGFIFSRYNSTRNVNMEFFATRPFLDIKYQVHSRSLLNLADVPAVFTTSALHVVAPYLQEFYSSEGPTNGPGGIADGGLIKPDIAAYANVSTVTYGTGVFNGTSAAAPHVSAAAALVKSAALSYTPDQTQWYLQSQSIDMGALGKDTLYGYGRLYLGDPAVFQTPPDISGLPDQYLAQNSSLSQAIDLWAYTSDPYTPDEQLIFSLDNTPDPGAGVNIVNNRYLSISPQLNWSGQTPVSVRVTSPFAQFDIDQLEVVVLAPPDISNLPNQVLPVNSSLNPAVDLWAYSTDAYYADEQLIFSLDNSPDPNSGVSLVENRYLHINPLPDWTGQTQVSVRTLSPLGLSDTDAFNLHVLAPPDMTALPDQYAPTNVNRQQVIDLWAYTYDAYIPDDQMAFTIDNTPAVEAGVSISQNRYIDIQPATDWIGETQVLVRATTAYNQSDTESFNVYVGQYKIWNGNLNQEWENGLNWTPEGVPGIQDSVIIPAMSNQPTLSAPAAINSLVIETNAILDMQGYPLSVEDKVTNHGALRQTQTVSAGETTRFLQLTNLAGDQDRYLGVDILPIVEDASEVMLQSEDLPVTVTIAGEQFCNLRFSGVLRCFDIQVTQSLTASLTFYFTEKEVNSLLPESLAIYKLDSGWNEVNASYTSGNNALGYFLVAPGQLLPGTFALDQSGSPTHAFMLPLVLNNFIPLDSAAVTMDPSITKTDNAKPTSLIQLLTQAWIALKENLF